MAKPSTILKAAPFKYDLNIVNFITLSMSCLVSIKLENESQNGFHCERSPLKHGILISGNFGYGRYLALTTGVGAGAGAGGGATFVCVCC